MKILVLLKQVPDSDEVKLNPETGTMIREGVGTVINPLDLHALETALRIKETGDHSVAVVSMGPPAAEEAVREAIAMGADRAVLLTDRKFAGADTWATAMALARFAEKEGPFDLILAGEKATDGETGQVGPETGSMLGIPVATYVSRIVELDKSSITIEREVEDGKEVWKLPLPSLVSVTKDVNEPRLPTLNGKKLARNASIESIGNAFLELDPSEIGLKGSPTRVVRIGTPKLSRKVEMYEGSSIRDGIDEIKKRLSPYLEVNHE
ncbi:MAG: electron transfer flavoprotein subunit beta/FixA family protein [Mesotoga sp.]|uniref:electron transfer flavoprotein subunit beta/FixA family protein n=1 Tax=Mesotoga sp. TaxID=2053577 RepID=UPI0026258525|nr:electron transfer flavoprotein subunit beta/FixA family protein [Mesotoga sp.]MDD3682149.1 electron transfer flavoprotein subunit beta/FixA family protein [Mesotoga sp.]